METKISKVIFAHGGNVKINFPTVVSYSLSYSL